MKSTKRKIDYERYLNDLYSETFQDYATTLSEFSHFTNKMRRNSTTRQNIIKYYNKGKLGSLQRKFDPIAFEVGYNDWLSQNKL